jgi:uncharacterized protein YjlB
MLTKQIMLKPNGWVPNNTTLPVLIYRDAVVTTDAPAEFEDLFSLNGWEGIWHDGVFDYHHYHSGAHEVLGIGGGQARLQIGGPNGEILEVSKGDCMVLPAGTGHMNLGADSDFHVVGAYPPGQHADILMSMPSLEQRERINRLQLPQSDPLQDASGFLISAWGVRSVD